MYSRIDAEMSAKKWSIEDVPNQSGKVAVVTGGNVGIGYELGFQLVSKGATVVIACRTTSKGEDSVRRMEQRLGKPINAQVIGMDLTNWDSIEAFAQEFKDRFRRLDILINNAGVVNLKSRQATKDGLELHMATNHYGHFALTGRLYEVIRQTKGARVVTMSSGSARAGSINFNDLNWSDRRYSRSKSYGDSKLANLLFARSLQIKFNKEGVDALSVSAHPGLSATERQQTMGIGGWFFRKLAQPVSIGALPALRAATDPGVRENDYYGPKYGLRGSPTLIAMPKQAYNREIASRLWSVSEEIVNLKW